MEEEQDRILLSSLGVKSANPEDIERHVLEKVIPILFHLNLNLNLILLKLICMCLVLFNRMKPKP